MSTIRQLELNAQLIDLAYKQREKLLLAAYAEGLSHKVIGHAIGVSDSAIRMRKLRSKRQERTEA